MSSIILTIYAAVTVAMAAITLTSDGGVAEAGSRWFIALWALLAAVLAATIVRRHMWHHLPSLLLHSSLLLILAGGLATYLGRESVRVTFTPGERTELSGGHIAVLDSFVTVTYPGSVAPRDYRSHLHIDNRPVIVAVNTPASIGGYTLRQDSYDSMGRSTIEVSRDPVGIPLSYAGYLLFVVGFIALMVSRRGKFRRMLAGALLVAVSMPASASLPGISDEDAVRLSRRQVLWNGRVAPFNTAATEFCRKISGTANPAGFTAERVTASIILYPEAWRTARILKIDGRRLARELDVDGGYVSVDDLFDSFGQYRLRRLYGRDKKLDKEVLSLDEKVELMGSLAEGLLLQPLPEDTPQLPQWRVTLEIIYNRVPIAHYSFMGLIAAGLLMLTVPRLLSALKAMAWTITALQSAAWIARWIIAGAVPLGSGGETMQFLSIAIGALTLIICRRSREMAGAGVLAAGFASLVAWLSLRNPAITPMMPVLHSPWLSIHVSLVMTAYALLTLTFASSLIGLCSHRRLASMYRLTILLLYPAVALLGAGIFTGAVWAQTSWGRYWAWDPKETWALITMMTYALPLHKLPGLTPKRALAITAASFVTVIMTYFGVNLLPSLHAYQ